MCKYVSERGIKLMCQEVYDKPILTVEDYTKWYNLFLLMPDGEVRTVRGEDMSDVAAKVGGALSHCWSGEFYEAMCVHLDCLNDERSHEVIVGRWHLEGHGGS